jgi:hypothetical protein
MTATTQDEDQLKLLSILYYVWGGLTACFSCFGLVYSLVIGGVLTAASREGNGPPPWVGGMVFIIVGFAVLFAIAVAVLTIMTGRYLAQRRSYTFCFVMAVITCLSVPIGTALGVFTIIVLMRPSVKQLFGQPSVPA